MTTEDVLRVAVDVSAIPPNPRGAGRYVIEVVRAMSHVDGIELALISRLSDGGRWNDLANSDSGTATVVIAPVAPDSRPLRLAWGELRLGRVVTRLDPQPQVLFCPHYTMPARTSLPCVVTIHDLTMVDHPEWHEPSKVRVFTRAMAKAAKNAAGLIFVSTATKERFLDRFTTSVPTFVIPHGIDHEHFSAQAPAAGFDAAVLQRLRIRTPYLLAVGTIEPRKNHASLVGAFNNLAASNPHLSLVIAGGEGWGTEAFEQAVAASPVKDRIVRLGFVDDAMLPTLFRNTSVACYPSSEEGFGIPALEAMACGATLVTTADTPMDTFANGVALTVKHPTDVNELTATIARALADDPDRQARGIAAADAYTWDACAASHLAAFHAVTNQ